MKRTILLVAVAAVAWSQGAMAQGAGAAIAQLRPDQRIRVSVDGHRVTGRLAGIDSVDVLISTGAERQRIPAMRVDTLWRRGSAARTGAWIGGVVGAVATTAFAHVVVSITCEGSSTCAGDHRRAWAYGIIGGGALGALSGAGAGALIGRWVRVPT